MTATPGMAIASFISVAARMLAAMLTWAAPGSNRLRAMGTRKSHIHVARTRRPCRVTVPRPAIDAIPTLPPPLSLRIEQTHHAAA